jgi:hypothetical protein
MAASPSAGAWHRSMRGRLLSLNEDAFDQDLSGGGGGWRAIAAINGCEISAADLIRDYRNLHSSKETIIDWHEGQMRATGGEYLAAIGLFDKSRKTQEQDSAGWNQYVDASIAFLKRDKPALVQARDALSKVGAPPGFDLRNGVFEIPNNSGKPFRMRWPPNIDVVDGLIKCFEKSYRDAYGDATCRPAPPAQGGKASLARCAHADASIAPPSRHHGPWPPCPRPAC